jgi:hypothetical protein
MPGYAPSARRGLWVGIPFGRSPCIEARRLVQRRHCVDRRPARLAHRRRRRNSEMRWRGPLTGTSCSLRLMHLRARHFNQFAGRTETAAISIPSRRDPHLRVDELGAPPRTRQGRAACTFEQQWAGLLEIQPNVGIARRDREWGCWASAREGAARMLLVVATATLVGVAARPSSVARADRREGSRASACARSRDAAPQLRTVTDLRISFHDRLRSARVGVL